MNVKNLLIGTAGHVDHGKSLLIQALTGIDTDRLKEEKERGISIELGFAYLTLPDGKKAGIVDVPGHEKFVRQMLAGTSGMDVVLMIIAADEGVMPQTLEHLHILNLLQINKGIVVLTKIDLVDEEWLSMIEQDIKEKLKGSFLEKAPFCKVSSTTGEGIPGLLQTIAKVLERTEARRTDFPARMPIDRVFSVQGFGTVVTGTLSSGVLQKGQEVMIEPEGLISKIRNIQVHGDQAPEACAGQRAAFNLSGLGVNDIKRGAVLVAPGHFHTGQIIDVEIINLASEERNIVQRQRIHFHIGTAEKLGRIHLLAQDELKPGETGLAQIILEEPVLAAAGDRFVIRYYSPATTIGGGAVLGIAPYKRKRFKANVLEELRLKAEGSSRDVILKELRKPLLLNDLIKITGLGKEETEQVLAALQRDSAIVTITEEGITLLWLRDAAKKWGEKVSGEAAEFEKRNPLRGGIGREELRKTMSTDISLKHWQLILEWGVKNHFFRIAGNYIQALPEVKLPEEIQKQVDCLLHRWEQAGLNPPDWKESAIACGIPVEKLHEYAIYLTTKGLWQRVGEYYFDSMAITKAKEAIQELIKEKGMITAAEARDYWQTSRKYAIPLLEHFDSIRITKRKGDGRVLY